MAQYSNRSCLHASTCSSLSIATSMAELMSSEGSTSTFLRIQTGVVLKHPRQIWEQSSAYQSLTDSITHEFSVERQILSVLGEHPRIVKSAYPSSITNMPSITHTYNTAKILRMARRRTLLPTGPTPRRSQPRRPAALHRPKQQHHLPPSPPKMESPTPRSPRLHPRSGRNPLGLTS